LDLKDVFERFEIPLDDWFQAVLDSLVQDFRPVFQTFRWAVGGLLDSLETFLIALPAEAVLVGLFLVTWQIANIRVAIFATIGMIALGFFGVWDPAMTTVALILTAVAFCVAIGVPLGVWAARSNRVDTLLRPILDVMQTLPGFVYMVPVVMLVGIGNVPGVIVTIVFALPPVIRLTNLGLREVSGEVMEAARAFGASEARVLFRVQFPLAAKTIMAGVNQTIMMALAMVVYASMIAVEGLGQMVLRGIGRLDMGLAALGGLGIVILAMVIDRISQASIRQTEPASRWSQGGPVGLVLRWMGPAQGAQPAPRGSVD
jgi:glycine betaine/proline transport system permease protein